MNLTLTQSIAPNLFFASTQEAANDEAILFGQSQLACVIGNTKIVLWCDNEIDSYIVPKNTFYAPSQEQADELATAFAYNHLVCGDALPPTGSLPRFAPVVTTATLSASEGVEFSYQITASNSPILYSATGLPAGLSVNTSTGVISGIFDAINSYSVNISATNNIGTGTAVLTINVSQAPPVGKALQFYSTGTGALWEETAPSPFVYVSVDGQPSVLASTNTKFYATNSLVLTTNFTHNWTSADSNSDIQVGEGFSIMPINGDIIFSTLSSINLIVSSAGNPGSSCIILFAVDSSESLYPYNIGASDGVRNVSNVGNITLHSGSNADSYLAAYDIRSGQQSPAGSSTTVISTITFLIS